MLALERALEGRDLDFCLLFSSLSTTLGGLGFVAYTAANAFMDAYVHYRNRSAQRPWLSVSWDTWQVSAEIEQGTGLGGSVAVYAMNSEEGIEAFVRVLQSREYRADNPLYGRSTNYVFNSGLDGYLTKYWK